MKVCPQCGRVLSFNSHFGAFICDRCNWEDNSVGRTRCLGNKQYRITNRKLKIQKLA